MKESMDIKTLEEAFEKIYNMGGKEVLCSSRLLSYFMDVAPSLKKYKSIIKSFIDVEGNKTLFNVRILEEEKQKAEIKKVIQRLQDEYFIDRNTCIMVCEAFCKAIGIKETIFEKNNIQQYKDIVGEEIENYEDEKINLQKEIKVCADEEYNKNNGTSVSNSNSESKEKHNGIIIVLAILAIVFVVMFCKDSLGKKNNAPVIEDSGDTYEGAEDEENVGDDVNEDNYESEVPYTDNEDMNISDCLTTDAYEKVESSDGSFSFAYPKYVFNNADVDKTNDSYYFYYEDSNEIKMSLNVYTEECVGDAVENTRNLYDDFNDGSLKVLYEVKPKNKTDENAMARTIVAGKFYYEDGDNCIYYVGANDGKKNYIMEIYYPDSDPEYDYDDVNYIVDCLYRYCSFAGGTYKPRTWEMFSNDQMGEKKTSSTGTTLTSSADRYTNNKKKSFYGIWTEASKSFSEVEEYKEKFEIKGFDCSIFLTSEWDNLNKEDWYALSVGVYSDEEDAKKNLPEVQKEYRDAYIKYSGNFCG